MGVEYGLYNMEEKTYLWLGKRVPPSGFQRDAHEIAKFVTNTLSRDCELAKYADYGDLPHEVGGWTEVMPDTWPGSKSG